MNNPDYQEMKQRLENRLQELNVRVENLENELDHPKDRDWNESAQEAEGDEVMEELGNNSLVEIRAIEAALLRIENDIYGICSKCSNEIREDRLDLVPHTPFCCSCA